MWRLSSTLRPERLPRSDRSWRMEPQSGSLVPTFERLRPESSRSDQKSRWERCYRPARRTGWSSPELRSDSYQNCCSNSERRSWWTTGSSCSPERSHSVSGCFDCWDLWLCWMSEPRLCRPTAAVLSMCKETCSWAVPLPPARQVPGRKSLMFTSCTLVQM